MPNTFKPVAWLRQIAFSATYLWLLLASGGAGADVPNPSGGPGIGVATFAASGPYSYMGKGLSEMLITDLVSIAGETQGAFADCKAVIVEIARRKEIEAEIALQQSPLFDPTTRVSPGHLIQADYMIEGRVTVENEEVGWDLQVRKVGNNQNIANDRGHAKGEEVFDSTPGIARRLLAAICGKKPPAHSTWTMTMLAPMDEGAPAPGQFSVKVEMNRLRFECNMAEPVAGLTCEPFGTFSVTSVAGPSDGACAVHMEPSALTVDISNNDGRGYLMFGSLQDPTNVQEPLDYHGIVFVEWPAVSVCEQAGENPCACAGTRFPQTMGRYVLLTGDAGKQKIRHGIRTLSGRCAPAGGDQYGGACTGDKPLFEWNMTQ